MEPKPSGFWSQPHLSGPLGAGTVLHEAETLFFPTGGLARNSACFPWCIISRGLTVWRRQEVGCRVPAHTRDLWSVVNLRGWSKAPRRRFRDAAAQGALGGREHSLDVHVPLLEGNQAWPACPTPATSPGSPEPFHHRQQLLRLLQAGSGGASQKMLENVTFLSPSPLRDAVPLRATQRSSLAAKES